MNGLKCNYFVILLFWEFLYERVAHSLDVFTLQVNNRCESTDLTQLSFIKINAFKLYMVTLFDIWKFLANVEAIIR